VTCPEPLPRIARFERLAYGMFVHWGLYSQLGKGEWIMDREAIPAAEYNPLAKTFTAAGFDARALARLAREAGMRYITLTTRHHEGFSLYDTRGLSDFDAPHSAAGRDLVAEFVEGCRDENIMPFFYHTLLDWQWQTATCDEARFAEYLDYLRASVEVLCTQYGEIGGLWFDGTWSRQADWQEDRLYGLIRKHQPEAIIVNNTGLGARGVVGHPEIDSTTFEQGLPEPPDRTGRSKYVAGEMCQTFNAHWGIGANDFAYISPREIIANLCLCRKAGANYQLNVGPTADGAVPEYETAALRRAGQWVAVHAEPIRNGRPTPYRCGDRDFVLAAGDKLYYFAFDLGARGHANVTVYGGKYGPRAIEGLDRPIVQARWMDSGEVLDVVQDTDTGLAAINTTGYPYGMNTVVRVAELET